MSKKSEEFSKKRMKEKKWRLALAGVMEDELRGGTKVQYQIKKDDFEV